MNDFSQQIVEFNKMYNLPVAPYPTIHYQVFSMTIGQNYGIETAKNAIQTRLGHLKKILIEEVEEVDDLILSYCFGFRIHKGREALPKQTYGELELLTDLADWLGDIQVYCASEMVKFGLPLKEVLTAIMHSNFSKLGVDGKAIYDNRGKVMKGPGYWKPEPQIKELLKEKILQATNKDLPDSVKGIVWVEPEGNEWTIEKK